MGATKKVEFLGLLGKKLIPAFLNGANELSMEINNLEEDSDEVYQIVDALFSFV